MRSRDKAQGAMVATTLARYFIEVYCSIDVQNDRVQPGDAQQLIDEAIHAGHIGLKLDQFPIAIHGFECCCNDCERCAQFVSGICREPSLNGEAILQAVERTVHGRHERSDFAGQVMLRAP